MASLNKVQLIGNCGRDPETKYLANGDCVTNLAIATSEKWTDANGEKQEKTEWHRVTLFKRVAEVAGEYLRKGSSCYVEGKLVTRKFTNKEGNEQYVTEIHGFSLQLLGGNKPDGAAPAAQRPVTQRVPQAASGGASRGSSADEFDDSIPFVSNCASWDAVSSLARRLSRAAP